MSEHDETPTESTGSAGPTGSAEPQQVQAPAAGRPVRGTLLTARARNNVARVVWVVCAALALVLAVAAFTYALEANQDNSLVTLARNLADTFDLGFFDLDNPVKEFDGKNAEVKTALFNYGLGCVVYLVVGRVLERVIRP